MRRYNVEIFDTNLDVKSHTNASDITYEVDYLSPVRNKVTVFNCDVDKGDYIRIQGDDDVIFGVVKTVASQSEKMITIEYGSFLDVLDTSVVFDTDLQGGTTPLETVIANLISERFINSDDALQNITGLSVRTTSSTADWGFNLKSDTEGKHTCIINLYDVIIARSLEKYGVVVDVETDMQEKRITLTVGKVNGIKVIEADLPNVIAKSIIIRATENDINKVVVYNTEDYVTKRTYYRHTNDTYDTINDDRIVPVVQGTYGVSVESGKTFAQSADSKAAEVFSGIKYNNLIELSVLNDDALVKPKQLGIGQVVNVVSNGIGYESILTGYNMDKTTTLVFGTIRLDLTKVIKRRS